MTTPTERYRALRMAREYLERIAATASWEQKVLGKSEPWMEEAALILRHYPTFAELDVLEDMKKLGQSKTPINKRRFLG